MIIYFPGQLPVEAHAQYIISRASKNDVLIIVSETGSGKTTQVPQILVDAYPGTRAVVSQPRRVAAVSVASRVAEERRGVVGQEVGYAVRFDDRSGPRTRIRYVTEGILLREASAGDGLRQWDWVIVDEVHERSVNGDLVLGLVKGEMVKKKRGQEDGARLFEGKLVVMSATTDVAKLENWFRKDGMQVSVLRIPGRTYPVDVLYSREPIPDFIDGAVCAALQVHVDYEFPGDILVFLPGQDEIMTAIYLFREHIKRYLGKEGAKTVAVYPLYASLPHEEQMRALGELSPNLRGCVRKIIFSTNVAETSITIKGIRYVIDSGVAKVRGVHSERGVLADVLRTQPISQAQAAQRSGRAGRISSGMAFRLYTESAYSSLNTYPVPEALRIDAASSILHIAAFNINPLKFDFLDTPPKHLMTRGFETLVALGALDAHMKLTNMGRVLSILPVDPMLARSVIESIQLNCVEQMLTLAAMLSVDGNIFFSPQGKREAANAAHRRFVSEYGDHLTLVAVYNQYSKASGRHQRKEFCKDHFLNERTLNSAVAIRDQLSKLVEGVDKKAIAPLFGANEPSIDIAEASQEELLRRCVVAGYFRNAARRAPEDGKYALLGNGAVNEAVTHVDIHPSSALRLLHRKRFPEWIVFDELVMTSKPYLRTVSAIEKIWLLEHSGQYYESVESS